MNNFSIMILAILIPGVDTSFAQDDLENIGPDGTPIASRLIDGITVTIFPELGNQLTARTYNADTLVAFNGGNNQPNSPQNPGNVSGTRFISNVADTINFANAQPITFEFSQPISLFGLTTLDLLEEGEIGAEIKLQAFDQADNLLDEHVRSEPQGPSGLDLDWSVSGNGIMKVLLRGSLAGGFSGYGIDDLVLSSSTTGIETTKLTEATGITLYQNRPNPFNSSTLIQFTLQVSEKVSLKIYDIRGKHVATPISEKLDSGDHTYRWDASGLPSGIYIFRLRAARVLKTQKTILLK